MSTLLVRSKYLFLSGFISCLISSCNYNTERLSSREGSLVQDSVQLMAESIARDISHEGPAAWLRYFENTPEFFMASDGILVFPNIDTATNFINNKLIKAISKIQLRWSDIRIDPLSGSLASIAANYHEDITDSTGTTTPHDGFFTGIAHKTTSGWKLLNAHWSSKVTH